MVFERLTDSLSWSWFTKQDSVITNLVKRSITQVEEGFDPHEAKNLAFLIRSQYSGKLGGLLVGTAFAVTWKQWYNRIAEYIPLLRIKQLQYRLLAQSALVLGSVLIGDFIFTGHRQGGNNYWSNNIRLNNMLYQHNKWDIISNFRVLDRKFTQEEVKQFNARRQIMNAPHRKWIFNEYVYTPEEFLKLTQNAETKLPPWKQSEVIKQIHSENPHRPLVELEPFRLKDHVDATGIKYGVKTTAQPGWSSL